MVPLQLKDPLELFIKRREINSGSAFLSDRATPGLRFGEIVCGSDVTS